MTTEIRTGKRKFYDDEHFPGGIDRAGFFTISEANYLIDFGFTLNGLSKGEIEPSNEAELEFVNAIRSQMESQAYGVKLWRKYLKAVYKVSHRASANSSFYETPINYESYDEA